MRPEDLPDFRNPPLNEVVLGIQFRPAPSYQQIRAGEVWALFRNEFPKVRELPALPPMFETFGPVGTIPQIDLQLIAGATHDRFWFLSREEDELIQFQQDRLLHNWRKVGDESSYPRFEKIMEKFEQELITLENYFASLSPGELAITQCEISYVNHIIPADQVAPVTASDWMRFVDFGQAGPENFSINSRWTISTLTGNPQGRLIVEATTGVNPSGKKMLVLTLTARGTPETATVSAALAFLIMGRELIVRRFTDLTTDSAHEVWQRIK